MNIVLWVLQALLALAFGMTGTMKLTQPKEKLAPQMPWVNDFSQSIIRGIGLLELLGAIGLILPALTGILPFLTPLDAVGLVCDTIGAMLIHLRRTSRAAGAGGCCGLRALRGCATIRQRESYQ
jgi:uncharacterized membrane protein YphA (DoxX/SURF4 family)